MQIVQSKVKGMLLYDISQVYERLLGVLKNEALLSFPAFILIGALLAFLFGMDFGGIIKRAFLGMMAIFVYGWFFISAGNIGFTISDKIISRDNHILKDWKSASTVRTEGFRDTYKRDQDKNYNSSWFGDKAKDTMGFFIWIISNFALWFVKISFTMGYYFPLITIPIVAVINILPITSKAIDGAMIASIWVAVTPIVVSIILEIINAIVASDNIMESASWISKALMSILFAFYLISSFTLSYKMLGQSGISEGVSQIGQSFGTGMVSGGIHLLQSKISRFGKRFVVSNGKNHSPLRKLTLDPAKTFKSKAYQRAHSIRTDKPQTAEQIVLGKTFNRTSEEKRALITNTIANPIKAIRDRRDRIQLAKSEIKTGNQNKTITPGLINKMRDDSGKQKINSKGVTYGARDKLPLYQRTIKLTHERSKRKNILKEKNSIKTKGREGSFNAGKFAVSQETERPLPKVRKKKNIDMEREI